MVEKLLLRAPGAPALGAGYKPCSIFSATGSTRLAGIAFTPASAPVFSAANEVRIQPGVAQLAGSYRVGSPAALKSNAPGWAVPWPISASVGVVPNVALAAPLL